MTRPAAPELLEAASRELRRIRDDNLRIEEPDFHTMTGAIEELERRLSLAQTEIKGHMRVKDELQGRIAELEKDWETDADYVRMAERIKELEKLLNEAMENLIWCGGSADFGWGGKAQIGYDKGPRATIAAIHEALKSRA